MLLAAEGAAFALQVISVAGILGDPLNFIAAVGLGSKFRNGALQEATSKDASRVLIQLTRTSHILGKPKDRLLELCM